VVPSKTTNRYPRRGERVAPYTLREFLMEPIPARFGEKLRGEALKLCDLDESVWQRLPVEAIDELSQIVVERISAYHVRKIFQHRHFPRPPEGANLANLKLENRTRRCLVREGFDEHPQALGDHTIGEIMSLRAFGPRCLVDLLSALESSRGDGAAQAGGPSWAAGRPVLAEKLTAAAARLGELSDAQRVRDDDPRFARLMHALDVEAHTARELAERLLARSQDPPDPAYVVQQVEQLVARIAAMPRLTVEQELIEIFTSTPNQRNAEILIGYYGWADGRQHTLTEIGDRFGITRERTRQICAKLTKKPKNPAAILAPVMDRALALVEQRLPAAAAALEAELHERGWTAVGMPLENLATAAALLGRRGDFRVIKIDPDEKQSPRLAVRPDQVAAVPAIADVAKKDVYFHGLATVAQIERLAAARFPDCVGTELVRQTLQSVEGFAWLDESQGWFRIRNIGKHGLPKTVDKVLAVAGRISVGQLRAALGRNRRLWKTPPPESVLLQFCRDLPGVKIDREQIVADPPRDWRKSLTGVELKLVSVLTEHGPVMERGALEDICVGDGMNRFSFHAFVSWSPVIEQLGHSVYGLLGAAAPQPQIDALLAARRTRRVPRRVLDSHGWTDDGKVWLSYRLSKAASTYAVITVPAALKQVVRGRFTLLAPGGHTIGTLATKDGRAWGLGAFLRQRGARIDDHIRLTLDLQSRTATVSWDDAEGDGPP
jgi:hypothetical protein